MWRFNRLTSQSLRLFFHQQREIRLISSQTLKIALDYWVLERVSDKPGFISVMLSASLHLCVCFTHSSLQMLICWTDSCSMIFQHFNQWTARREEYSFASLFHCRFSFPSLNLLLISLLLSACFFPVASLSLVRKPFLVEMPHCQNFTEYEQLFFFVIPILIEFFFWISLSTEYYLVFN